MPTVQGWYSQKHYAYLTRNPAYHAPILINEKRAIVIATSIGEPPEEVRKAFTDYRLVSETPGREPPYLAYASGNLSPAGKHHASRHRLEHRYESLLPLARNYAPAEDPTDAVLRRAFAGLRARWQVRTADQLYPGDDIMLEENRWNHIPPRPRPQRP